MICSKCNQYIEHNATTAQGPDGYSHARCAKLATAQGKELSVVTLSNEINRLKRRIQALEQQVESHHRNIDFCVGGC